MTQTSSYEDAHVPQPGTETVLDEQVGAAPEPLRSYIQELERQADPASNLRELVCGRAHQLLRIGRRV